MKVRKTFILEEQLVEKFERFCVEQNGGKFDHGIYSKGLTEAIDLWINSKKPKDETIDIEELNDNTDDSPVQDLF